MALLNLCKHPVLKLRTVKPEPLRILSRAVASESPSTPSTKKESSEIVAPEAPRDVLVADMISGAPTELRHRPVRIYQPTRNTMQSGGAKSERWRIDFDTLSGGGRWENPLMGWASSADYMQGTRLSFRSKEDAIHFSEKQGWDYYVQNPTVKRIPPKNYAENYLHVLQYTAMGAALVLLNKVKDVIANATCGLINQSVIAFSIAVICVTGHEIMKRRRRGDQPTPSLGSRESWEFGYLFQGRSWARYASPPSPAGWPLSWVMEVIRTSEYRLNELCGVDAALYTRFLRGCFWFAFLHTLTTFPVLFSIHVRFSENSVSRTSMTRASISSLVRTVKGLSLLWIHILLLFWITLTWIVILCWICSGAFKLRQGHIYAAARRMSVARSGDSPPVMFPHPHPPYIFNDSLTPDDGHPNAGLRSRTIMVSNVPQALRDERELKEYFTYYMSRKVDKPSMGLTSSVQPGLLNKCIVFLLNRLKRRTTEAPPKLPPAGRENSLSSNCDAIKNADGSGSDNHTVPVIERVIIARRMTELASLIERREEIMSRLEAAHIKLANRILLAVKVAMDEKSTYRPMVHIPLRTAKQRGQTVQDAIQERCQGYVDVEEDNMNHTIDVLGPYVEQFGLRAPFVQPSWKALNKAFKNIFHSLFPWEPTPHNKDCDGLNYSGPCSLSPSYSRSRADETIWEALLSLPRSSLDAYQPLISLSLLFRGKMVPAIDYYTAKINALNNRIIENRSKAITEHEPASTAFVTFSEPSEARRACKYLAVHPENPLACLVVMAPAYEDLDWSCVMKSSFNTEFVKDWVVNAGVWLFTLFWLFPVSLLVGLVSIQNISRFWPSLKSYLDRHAWQEEIIQSFLPTISVSSLALLIPVILFLITKKAHTITTLSALHDLILTRYYKFLVVNVLVFFCVGTAALQSFLVSFKSSTTLDLLQIVADSFPSAGPFYVGWLIFSTAIHGCFELALVGLPLLTYPSTKRQITPRKRSVDIRPRTFNYYYWIPNHLLALHVLLLFSILNPFVLPFGALYFSIQTGIIKNQFIHVYAKKYEGNGKLILVRVIRYSFDGKHAVRAVFLAYMVVLKKSVNVGLTAFLIAATAITKIALTRICRAQFEIQDIEESETLKVRKSRANADLGTMSFHSNKTAKSRSPGGVRSRSLFSSWKIPLWTTFVSREHQGASFPRLPHAAHLAGVQSITAQAPQMSPNALTCEASVQGYPIAPHFGPPAWDDQTMVDRPYDNPFYSRPIDNALWLPRNPCGLLDLDDTVDLKIPLTVTGDKLTPGIISPMGPTRTTSIVPRRLREGPSPDGTEEIDLPEVIVKRIKSREADVEYTTSSHPSIYRHKTFNHASTTPRPGQQRTMVSEGFPDLHCRSLSDGSGATYHQTSKHMSLQLPQQIFRTLSPDIEQGVQPGVHIPVAANVSEGGPPAQNISAGQAIAHEVEAEEDLINCLESEKADERKTRTSKSWLTSWIFSKVE
ncbi:hypothetical protein AX15_001064 [Amanita polypyramis BW_CC]|nr:hypothetical protein AX15_001064 [Amanita polypyramis BW_CC]